MWKEYFRFVKLKPGKVVTALLGEIDFSSDSIPLEKIKQLYDYHFPYLEITEEGKAELYGIYPMMGKVEIAAKPHRLKKSNIHTSLS